MTIRLGTRASHLAMAQARLAVAPLTAAAEEKVEIVPLSSLGDEDQVRPLSRFLAPGAFTRRLDDALLDGSIDLAVHSLKDVPLDPPAGISRTYTLERADPADRLLLASGHALGALDGLRIGTSAPRRQTQLASLHPDAVPIDVRGNITTRVSRIAHGELDGLFVASAVFARDAPDLPEGVTAHRLPLGTWPTAPGQGALALQARAGDETERLLAGVEDVRAHTAVTVEREILRRLGGGCGTPLGATCLPPGHPEGEAESWRLHATLAHDGSDGQAPRLARATVTGEPDALVVQSLAALWSLPKEEPSPAPPAPHGRILLVQEPDPLWVDTLAAEGWEAIPWWPFTTHMTPDTTDAPALAAWDDADWVLVTSRRAVEACRRLDAAIEGEPKRVACTGPTTARALRGAGLPVTLMPKNATGHDTARLLVERMKREGTKRVLWLCGANTRPEPLAVLESAGVSVERLTVYDVRPKEVPAPSGRFDLVLFTSPATARAVLDVPPPALFETPFAAIGPTTGATIESLGHPMHILPEPTPQALVRLLSTSQVTP